jgi:hypothetical protein
MKINLTIPQRLMAGLLLNEYSDPDMKKVKAADELCKLIETTKFQREVVEYSEEPVIRFRLDYDDDPTEFNLSLIQAEVLKAVIDRYPKRRRDLVWCEPLLAQL